MNPVWEARSGEFLSRTRTTDEGEDDLRPQFSIVPNLDPVVAGEIKKKIKIKNQA
jgi:hypothetical protein